MKVILVDALDVFDDDNKGFRFGLEQTNMGDYVEWFKTEKERETEIKKHKMIIVSQGEK
jgi:hypothetical protein